MSYQDELKSRQQTEARSLSDAELRKSLDWNRALVDHSCEIGDYSGNAKAGDKIDVIEAEMKRRGIK